MVDETSHQTMNELIVLNVMGPYREPREPAFSFDYSVQRPDWATPQGVRVKIAIQEELESFKNTILQLAGASPGQQLRVNQMLCRAIADRKLQIADEEGMLQERRDVMIDPFMGPLAHLFERLESWIQEEQDKLRQEIKERVGL